METSNTSSTTRPNQNTNGNTVTVNQNTANLTAVCSDGRKLSDMAQQVLLGQWGNNPNRREDLTAAGCDYATIQTYVNQLVETGQAAYGAGVTVENPEVEIEIEEGSTTVIAPIEEPEEEEEEEEEEEPVVTTSKPVTQTAPAPKQEISPIPFILVGTLLIAIIVAAIVYIYKKSTKKPAERPPLRVRPLTFDKTTRTFHESTESELAAEKAKQMHEADKYSDGFKAYESTGEEEPEITPVTDADETIEPGEVSEVEPEIEENPEQEPEPETEPEIEEAPETEPATEEAIEEAPEEEISETEEPTTEE